MYACYKINMFKPNTRRWFRNSLYKTEQNRNFITLKLLQFFVILHTCTTIYNFGDKTCWNIYCIAHRINTYLPTKLNKDTILKLNRISNSRTIQSDSHTKLPDYLRKDDLNFIRQGTNCDWASAKGGHTCLAVFMLKVLFTN